MVNFYSCLILSGLLCFAPETFAHPGHGPHAVPHWWEMSSMMAGAGYGIWLMTAGTLLYASGSLLGRKRLFHAERVIQFIGVALGGGGLWLLLG